jgi:adenylate cyclase
MSGDPEQQYFSDGMTEDIITDLSKISGLLVVARNTVFTYKDKPVKVQQAARELGVKFILEGSVRKSGSRVRITGQLIDGNDGNHIWAERYDRELTDIFLIQDEIRQAIVDQLKVKLLPTERKAIDFPPTGNVEAYTYYLRGRQFSHERTKPYLLLARRMFAKAVELDPQYARAYAGIAICDVGLHSWHSAEVSLDAILANSAKALALDPNLAEAHAARALALHHSERPAEAIDEFERALALDPDLYEANYFYARLFSDRGDFEKAATLFERAAEIQPEDYLAPISLLAVCRSLGRHAERENGRGSSSREPSVRSRCVPRIRVRPIAARLPWPTSANVIGRRIGRPVPWPRTRTTWSLATTLRACTRSSAKLTRRLTSWRRCCRTVPPSRCRGTGPTPTWTRCAAIRAIRDCSSGCKAQRRINRDHAIQH